MQVVHSKYIKLKYICIHEINFLKLFKYTGIYYKREKDTELQIFQGEIEEEKSRVRISLDLEKFGS